MGDTQLDDLAKLVGASFIQRRDAIALQMPEGKDRDGKKLKAGRYKPWRERVSSAEWKAGNKGELYHWKLDHIKQHLQGEISLGHYQLDMDSKCRVVAYDCDFENEYEWKGKTLAPREIFGTDHPAAVAMNQSIRCVADTLAYRLKKTHPRLRVCTSFSGSKGIHVYGLFPEPVPAAIARHISVGTIAGSGAFEKGKASDRGKPCGGSDTWWRPFRGDLSIGIEVFPKQGEVSAGGFGNLLGLPLGYNLKTRQPKYFYDPTSDPSTLDPIDPTTAITQGLQVK